MKFPRNWNFGDKHLLLHLVGQDLTYQEMSEEIPGRDADAIRHALRVAGISRPKRKRPSSRVKAPAKPTAEIDFGAGFGGHNVAETQRLAVRISAPNTQLTSGSSLA